MKSVGCFLPVPKGTDIDAEILRKELPMELSLTSRRYDAYSKVQHLRLSLIESFFKAIFTHFGDTHISIYLLRTVIYEACH